MVKPAARVLVYTRVRPQTSKEAREGLVVSVDAAESAILLSDKQDREAHVFKCDGVFAPNTPQEAIFEAVGQPVLDATLEGYNGCVLAYGQTGSGKTHTLLNPGDTVADSGLVPRIAAALFFRVGQDLASVVTVRVSFLQIYNEQIDDLLKPAGQSTNLRLRTAPSGAVEVDGATSVRVSSPAALMQLFNNGRRNLVYAETRMNKTSSRSHAVFQLTIEKRVRLLGGDGAADAEGAEGVDAKVVTGKLTIADLAGSERVKRSGADADLSGVRFKEAVNINTSLLGLGSVMKALGERQKFVPYKDSKLTTLLADSLGGNCRTALVVCVSPALADHSETGGALEFGARAMKVAVHAHVNE
ncbi:P-loop containing nucleoside triphosphate hydrolase protein, partial [Pavlovales sp. CCMP2436]